MSAEQALKTGLEAGRAETKQEIESQVRAAQRGAQTLSAINRAGASTEARRAYTTQLTMADFGDVYDAQKIQRDQRHCEGRRGKFAMQAAEEKRRAEGGGPGEEATEAGRLAEAAEVSQRAQLFEKLFVRGVQMGRWLGNLPDQDGTVAFSTRTYQTTDFDDIGRRLDAFTTLKFKTPLETDAGIEISQLPLGFDVTLNTKREVINDKLTKHYNHQAELPFGFSQLDYYTDGRTKGTLGLIPRYVIGISPNEVEALARAMRGTTPDLKAPRVLEMRFKVLSEIRAENELYDAMLPDDAIESTDVRVRTAAAYLEAADAQLNQALNLCTEEMLARRTLPTKVLDKVAGERGGKRRKTIEEYLLVKAHAEHVDRMRDIHSSKGTYYLEDQDLEEDPFVAIMTRARQLTEAAYDEDSPLQAERGLGVHNRALALEV